MTLAAALTALAIAPFVALSAGGSPVLYPSTLLLGSAILGLALAVAAILYLQPSTSFLGMSLGEADGRCTSAPRSDPMYVEAAATDDIADDEKALEGDLSRLAEVQLQSRVTGHHLEQLELRQSSDQLMT